MSVLSVEILESLDFVGRETGTVARNHGTGLSRVQRHSFGANPAQKKQVQQQIHQQKKRQRITSRKEPAEHPYGTDDEDEDGDGDSGTADSTTSTPAEEEQEIEEEDPSVEEGADYLDDQNEDIERPSRKRRKTCSSPSNYDSKSKALVAAVTP